MRVRLNGLRQLVENVQGLVLPAPLVTGQGKRFVQGFPEAKRDASIWGEDITISLSGVPDFLGRWLCPDCNAEVARFSRSHWSVITRRGSIN
jgi:hypothetical protein